MVKQSAQKKFREQSPPFYNVLKNDGDCCARTGRVGQAHTDLFAPSAIRFIELPQTRPKPPSEHEATPSRHCERSERLVRGVCEV